MGSRAQQARERIIDAADQLFYTKGFEHTSFADIADAVQISRGNFYYHFKTKDDILEAVIAKRLAHYQGMLAEWDAAYADPRQRLLKYIDNLCYDCETVKQCGCPIGSLCLELARLHHTAQPEANAIMLLLRDWVAEQFRLLGCKDAAQRAMQLIARMQGIAVTMGAFDDGAFYQKEIAECKAWVEHVCDTQ